MLGRPHVHATLLVAASPDGRSAGVPVREFWLLAVEPEPEPHFQDSPVGTPTEAGTRPASRSAVHAHWVEATFEPPHAGEKASRARPYALGGAVVGRGPVGDLLAQSFLDEFPDAAELGALQEVADRERARTDATRWDAERKEAIEEAQERLEEAVYASPFPHVVVLTVLAETYAGMLRRDFEALNLPRGRLVDAVGLAGARAREAGARASAPPQGRREP